MASFVLVLGGLFVVVLAVIVLLTRRVGGTIGASIFRARDFVSWTILTWQTLVQVCRPFPALLPLNHLNPVIRVPVAPSYSISVKFSPSKLLH